MLLGMTTPEVNTPVTGATRHAWELAESLSVPMVVLNPGPVLGQYDYRVTPSTRYIVQMLNGVTITIPGGLTYVDVRDVADAHVRALDCGVVGEPPAAAVRRRSTIVQSVHGHSNSDSEVAVAAA